MTLDSILDGLSGPVWTSLVAALLHTLWIGGAAALVAAGRLRRIPAGAASKRQAICLAALAATLAGGLAEWALIEQRAAQFAVSEQVSRVEPRTAETAAAPVVAEPTAAQTSVAKIPSRNASPPGGADNGASTHALSALAAFAWVVGVALMLTRMTLAVAGAGRLRRACRKAGSESPLQKIADELAAALGIGRKVAVILGDVLSGPAVVGAFRPVILWPAAWASGLPEWQMRAILAHELAHIARRDCLVNLFQMLVEALLFFNPAVWLLSRQLRIEREACCDAIAAKAIGEEGLVARALAEAAALISRPNLLPRAAMGFCEPAPKGGLIDRVRRLLDPGHRPSMRLPWTTFSLALAVAFAGLACFKSMGDEAAKAIMSPQERIAKITELRQEVATAEIPDREYTKADMLTLRGEISTWNGAPVPDRVDVRYYSHRPRNDYMMSLGLPGLAGRTNDAERSRWPFEFKAQFGEVWLSACAEGFSPALAGPFFAKPGGTIDGIRLVLREGFTGRIKITDEAGSAISGAAVLARTEDQAQISYLKGTSEADGVVSFDHLTTLPMTIAIRAPGFQEDEAEHILLKTSGAFPWTLRKAQITRGTTIERGTREPVPGVVVSLRRRDSHSWGITGAPELAVADAAGGFTIDQLRSDAEYGLWAKAPDGRVATVDGIFAGDQSVRIEFSPALHVHGRVPDASTISRNGALLPIAYNYAPEPATESNHNPVSGSAALTPDGKGGATFAIEGLEPCKLDMHLNGIEKQLDVAASIDDMVFDLAAQVADTHEAVEAIARKHPARKIIVRLNPPAGGPAATGAITAEYTDYTPNARTPEGFFRQMRRVQMPIGEDETARFEIPTPTNLRVTAEGLNGYWFPERWEAAGRTDTIGGNIESGAAPFEIAPPLYAAGGIRGRVVERDGELAGGVLISLVAASLPKAIKNSGIDLQIKSSAGGLEDKRSEFFASPLPLGGTYRIVASRGAAYASSDPIALTKADPISNTSIMMPETFDMTVLAVDETAAPIAGATIIPIAVVENHSFSSEEPTTGPTGKTLLKGIPATAPEGGKYVLQIKPKQDFQTASVEPNLAELASRTGDRTLRVTLQRGAVIAGKALDKTSGRPLQGIRVRATGAWEDAYKSADFSVEADALTGPDGSFRISRLAPKMPYDLHWDGGREYPSRRVSSNLAEPIVLQIEPSGSWLSQHPQAVPSP